MSRSTDIPAHRGLSLFVGAFTLFNAFIVYLLLVAPLTRWIQARSWVETPCIVETTRTIPASDTPQFTYAYHFDGREYRSSRHSILSGFLTGQFGMRSLMADHPPGQKTICYVNPSNPSQAILNREFVALMMIALLPFLFCLVGIFWFVTFRRQQKKSR